MGFANDMDAFNTAFSTAWFDLTTRYGSGTWSDNAKCDDGKPFPEELRHVEPPDVSKYKNLPNVMLGDDYIPASQTPERSMFTASVAGGVLTTVLIGIAIKRKVAIEEQ